MSKIFKITSKEEALQHIGALHPIGTSESWAQVWLDEIEQFGVENLPTEFLAKIAKRMLTEEGELCSIELEEEEDDDESVNPWILNDTESERMQNRMNGCIPPY